jgi:hypothetical protein
MVAVAMFAIIMGAGVGLRRRAERFNNLAARHGREANSLENLLEGSELSLGDVDAIIEEVHWHDAVADQYRLAASRPWFPFEPSPGRVSCRCSYHAARRAIGALR